MTRGRTGRKPPASHPPRPQPCAGPSGVSASSPLLDLVRRSTLGQALIRRLDIDVPIRVEGVPFKVYAQALRNVREVITARYESEQAELAWLAPRWRQWRWFFDVGGNIGLM